MTEISKVTIVNRMGMHARPAALLVELAGSFRSRITLEKDNIKVDGKSIMGVLMLAAAQGSTLEVQTDGDDAVEAMGAITGLVARGFDEE